MNRIVPSECLSLEEERSLIEALLSRTPFSSSGERLWQIVYPGYSLARFDISYLDYRCKNPMDAGCPSGSTSSRRFPGGLIFLEAR